MQKLRSQLLLPVYCSAILNTATMLVKYTSTQTLTEALAVQLLMHLHALKGHLWNTHSLL